MQENRSAYRLDQEGFLRKSHAVHGDRYDYSKAVYVNQRTKVCIICPVHGEFWQLAKNHMNGQGCPECGKEYARNWRKNDFNSFVRSSKERFGDNYTFPFIEKEYENSHSKLTIECNKCHNRFIKIACDHLTSPFGGCRHCYASQSEKEKVLADFVINLLPDETVRLNDRQLLSGMELDIYIPSRNLAIEYNGCYWHSEDQHGDKYYHVTKTERCEATGTHLVQIFEDEMLLHEDLVLSKIRHLLGLTDNERRLHARLCRVKGIYYNTASVFLQSNHIQSKDKATVYLGLYYKEELVGVMSFTRTGDEWLLSRYATLLGTRVVGGAGKLFKHFVREYNPAVVKSFADRRWSTTLHPNLYDRLGFRLDGITRPDYRYILPKNPIRFHKFNFRKKNLVKKYGFSYQMTEDEMRKELKALKVWDSGLLRYIWKSNFYMTSQDIK